MADHRNWKSYAARAWAVPCLALGLGLMFAVWGSVGVHAVTPEDSTPPGAAPAAIAGGHGDKDGNRIADGLEHKMQGLGANAQLRVIVTMAKGKGVAAARAAAGSFAVIRQFTIINGFTATMTRAQIEALSKAPGVVSIHDDIKVNANRADAMQAYGVAEVHSNSLAKLSKTYDGTGIGICVIDTGIHGTHAEFAGGKVKGFCDATANQCGAGGATTYTPFDDNGHGTHVSAIAGGLNGVARGASLWGAKVLDAAGSGFSTDIISGIEWCAAQPGVHVLNLSLSATGSSSGEDPMGAAANTAALSKVVVLAAGNTGPAQLQISTPAAAENPITVGATADWLSPVGPWRKGLAVFSSRGPTSDYRTKPDILAPGVDINSGWNDGGTRNGSGTSMAAPFVAGVAALMLDANSGLTPAAVKGIIGDTAVPRGDQSSTDAAGRPKNYDYGWGELDAYAAVAEADGAVGYTPTPFPVELYQNPTIADGTVWEYEFEVTDPNTPISAVVTNGGLWTSLYLGPPWNGWFPVTMGQDFDVQLHAPLGTPGGTLVDESTCEVDADTQCGTAGRQETLVADPADFRRGKLPLGTWRVRVEPWSDTDELLEEIIDLTVALGPIGGTAPPPPLPNVAPMASFTETTSGTQVSFTDTSTDSDGSVVSWSWNFGNDFSSSAQHPTYIYPVDGTYTVTLTVTDNDGATDTTSHGVTVSGSASNAAPTAPSLGSAVDNADGTATVQWVDKSTDETGFEVEREKQNRKLAWKGAAIIGTTGANVTQLTDASGTGVFRYRVRALNGAGASNWSGWAEVTVTDAGGGGGGGGGGKPCNPKKETCS